jgi:hypothetical protein
MKGLFGGHKVVKKKARRRQAIMQSCHCLPMLQGFSARRRIAGGATFTPPGNQ